MIASPSASPGHVPVLLERVVELLAPALSAPGAICVDATVGLGGHAEALLRRHDELSVIGIDRDPRALEISAQRLQPFGDRVQLVHAVYDELGAILAGRGIAGVQGVLFDLGVSSMQLDERERGFAYAYDAPLDMRMDGSSAITAQHVVNDYPVPELARVLREFGEERFALRIARRIEERRRQHSITSTSELADIVRDAIPAATRSSGGHPAKRTFQALRIEVNAELEAVSGALPAAVAALLPGGRIAALAYHSLEDRIVKTTFADWAADRTPPGLPVPLESAGPRLRLLTRGAERASAVEIAANSRAKSVRLRAGERLAGVDGAGTGSSPTSGIASSSSRLQSDATKGSRQ